MSSLLAQAKSNSAFLDEIRAKSKESLYFFVKAVLGFDKLSPNLHKEFCEHLQNLDQHRKPSSCLEDIIRLPVVQ